MPQEGLLHPDDPAPLTADPQDPAVSAAEEASPQAGAVVAVGTWCHLPERHGQLGCESTLLALGAGAGQGPAVSSVTVILKHTHTPLSHLPLLGDR